MLLKRSLARLQSRVHSPENATVPWGQILPGGLVLMYILVFFLSIVFTSTAADAPLDERQPEVLVAATLMHALIMLLLTVQYIQRALDGDTTSQSIWQALRLTPTQNTPIWIAMLYAFLIAILLDVVGLVLGTGETLPLPLDGLGTDDVFVFAMAALVVVILRPIVLEIIFRGVLYPALLKQMSAPPAILLSSVVYAVLSFALDPGYIWWGVVYPLVVSLVAGVARAATKSTQVAIGMHMMFGLFIVLRALLFSA
ncbi:MAG: CPBP family intramembrane glutamic endopeptidase [Anaerolineales bacterium]